MEKHLQNGEAYRPKFSGLILRRFASLLEIANLDYKGNPTRLKPATTQRWTVQQYATGQFLEIVLLIVADQEQELAAIQNVARTELFDVRITPSH
jgi:hypothetical protein